MNFEKIKKYIKENVKIIIGIIFIIIIVFYIMNIYYNAVKYSVNTLDDFLHYTVFERIYEDRNFELFDFAKKYSVWDCVNLGGRYFTMFIQILLGPNPYVDIIKKNEIVMVMNFILYFVSIYIFLYTIVSKLVLKNVEFIKRFFISNLVFLSIIILHNSYQFYSEIFTWFSAATSYSIPLSFLLLSISFFIILIESNNKYKLFLVLPIAITSIAALGGSVSIITIAFVLMLTLFIYVSINHKLNIVNIGVFFHYFCFALINVCSPGNYHRLAGILEKDISTTNDVYDPERIVIVFNSIIKIVIERLVNILNKPFFLMFFLLITSIIGLILIKMVININYQKVFLTIIPIIFMPYIVSLSFASGYQDKLEMYDRCFFIIDFSLILSIFIILIFGFMMLYNFFSINNRLILCEFIIVLMILINLFFDGKNKNIDLNDKDITKIELITVAIDESLNKYEKYHSKYIDVIKKLSENSGKHIVKINYIDNDDKDVPKYLMKFYDGKHMPFLASKDEYLSLFYDIDVIDVLEK